MSKCTDIAQLVCQGRAFINGKMHVRFAEVLSEGIGKTDFWPANKRTREYQTGGVYTVNVSENRQTAAFSEQPWQSYVGPYKDAKMIAAWKIADEAAEAAERNLKESKKVADAEAVMNVLEPLREIWRASDRTNRRLIELSILNYLQRGYLR